MTACKYCGKEFEKGVHLHEMRCPERKANEMTDSEQSPEPEKMFPVRLLKNYRPRGKYEIVGKAPQPQYPGVGTEGKLWEGTIVKLPLDEARALLDNVAENMVYGTDQNGKRTRKTVHKRFPLAERADALPV